MRILQLENQWGYLEKSTSSSFKSISIDESCPNLYLGINKDKNRCLLLIVPKGIRVDFRGETKENIRTSYNKRENCIVLELLDKNYNNLFNDLIYSLFIKIQKCEDDENAIQVFITTINKWADFLDKSQNSKLTKEIIKGLFGELIVLNEFLLKATSYDVNSVLEAWQGPYDTNTDFIFEDKNIEVKTKNNDSSTVKISSEFQLDNEFGKELELLVVSVESSVGSLYTIEMLVNKIRERLSELSGDVSIVLEALFKKGLYPYNLKDYSNYKFTPIKLDSYSCDLITETNMRFPRLIKSELPVHLKKVKYTINLQELDVFLISQKIFENEY